MAFNKIGNRTHNQECRASHWRTLAQNMVMGKHAQCRSVNQQNLLQPSFGCSSWYFCCTLNHSCVTYLPSPMSGDIIPPAEKHSRSTEAAVWMSGQLHLPAPALVAYLTADLSQRVRMRLLQQELLLHVTNVRRRPHGEIRAASSQHKPRFLQLEWKLKSAFRRHFRAWLRWEIIYKHFWIL